MIENLTQASFDPLLNETFEVFPEGMEKFDLQLVKITNRDSEFLDAFSLLFRGPLDRVFRHDTHKVKHPKMGEEDLFIGPVMYPKNDGIYYEVVFNRIKNE